MNLTMVIVALMVLFGALLIGKMLMEMFPDAGPNPRTHDPDESEGSEDDHTPSG